MCLLGENARTENRAGQAGRAGRGTATSKQPLGSLEQLALLEACSSRHTPWDSTQYAVRGTKYSVRSIRSVQYPARSIQYTQYTVSIRRTGHSVESKDACRMQHAECTVRQCTLRAAGNMQCAGHSLAVRNRQCTAYSTQHIQNTVCSIVSALCAVHSGDNY